MADGKGLILRYLFAVSLILAVLRHGIKVAEWIRLHHRERGGWEGTHHLANWDSGLSGELEFYFVLTGMHEYFHECS